MQPVSTRSATFDVRAAWEDSGMVDDQAGRHNGSPSRDSPDDSETAEEGNGIKPGSLPWFGADEGRRVASILDRLAADAGDPLKVSIASHQDAEFNKLHNPLREFVRGILALELTETKTAVVDLTFGWAARRVPGGNLQQEMSGLEQFFHAVLGNTSVALIRDLIADVILCARHDTTPTHATRTVNAYLSLSRESSVDPLHAALSISRANTIARARQLGVEAEVRIEAVACASRALETAAPSGVPAVVLEMLSVAPRSSSSNDAEIRSILDAAEELYTDPTAADWIADCRRRIARDPEVRADATKRQVGAYLAVAENETNGFRRMHWASAAAAIAERHGDNEMRNAAVRLMQAIPSESMEWKTFETDVKVPTSALRSHLRRYKFARDWRQAMRLFLASASPAGSYETNLVISRKAAQGSIRGLATNTVFGVHGLPEQNDADFDAGELIRTEQLALRVQGILLDLELREIANRFELPSTDSVGNWLSTMGGADVSHCRHFARAIELHLQGDVSSSARLTIPLIESCARSLLLQLNEPLYRIERGANPGKFPAMDFYISKLEELDLDPDWSRASAQPCWAAG
jgi:hypothetical protein